ncbi:MAG TPA: DPP IV N-terminal domain-containing protein, partial [Flavisolibacter sp.]|nr:DPP IV N-terminal domain-containing protein [Flavisolibacter sp.]
MNRLLITSIACALGWSCYAQQTTALTYKDYEQAESFLGYNTQKLIDHGNIYPSWLPGDRFWYRTLTPQGSEFILVDPAKGTRVAAFDQQKLAAALSSTTGKQYSADMLPFQYISFSPDGTSIVFQANGSSWRANLQNYNVTKEETKSNDNNSRQRNRRGSRNDVLSPDGTKAAFIKDYNLWIRDVATGKETQLTTDGIKDFGYATDNAGWASSDAPVLRWSPDSRKIATFKQDQRYAGDMYLVSTNVGHPQLKAWKYPLPGDKDIITIQRVIIDVENHKVTFINVPPDPHRATLSDNISSSGTFDDVDWNNDGSQLAFVSTSRDHKQEKFRIANTATGEVREVFEETVPTQYESGQGSINWRYLPATNEIIWLSEWDYWG